MKTNSDKFGTYVNIGNNYNSMNDEYRRNKILSSSKKFKIDSDELFLILENVIKQTSKIKRDVEEALRFKFTQENITLDYEFAKCYSVEKEIIIT